MVRIYDKDEWNERAENEAKKAWISIAKHTDPDLFDDAWLIQTPKGDVYLKNIGDMHARAEPLETFHGEATPIDTSDLDFEEFKGALVATYEVAEENERQGAMAEIEAEREMERRAERAFEEGRW